MLNFLLLSRTEIVRKDDSFGFVLQQPAIGRISHNFQRPGPSIDGAEALDAAKCAQRRVLHNILGVVGIAGHPLC